MAEVESADVLALELLTCDTQEEWQRRVGAHDTAIREAAKLEVRDYLLGRVAVHRQSLSARDARDLAVDDVLRKYATPGGENG